MSREHPTTLGLDEVMQQLKGWGSENTRRLYARMGAGEDQFGVTLGNLRALAKKLKVRHALALDLWATGNEDARVLATMILDPSRLTVPELEAMLKPITFVRLVDELVSNAVTPSNAPDSLRERWMDSPQEWVGRAGWVWTAQKIAGGQADGWDIGELLTRIQAGILSAPKKKQEVMNRCLVEIAVHLPAWTERCIGLGESLGRFDTTPVPKGCVSSYAPEWIEAALKRKRAGKKVGC